MRYDVADRSAIVTGGGSGIGAAIAMTLAQSGASVLVVDRDLDAARAVVGRARAEGGTAEAWEADVADAEVFPAMVSAAERLAPLRIAVNNAGVSGGSAPADAVTSADWRRVMAVNLDAVFHGMQAQLPAIAAHGGGAVINISSVLGTVGIARASAYVTSKHAVIGLTRAAALDFAPQCVRVTAVCPGFVRTPMLGATKDAGAQETLAQRHPLGRLGEPSEVAALVAFLASDAAAFITGSVHVVDGGYSAQ